MRVYNREECSFNKNISIMKFDNILKLIIPSFIIMFLVSSCGPSVTTTKKEPVDMDNYNSFAWLPSKEEIDNPNYDTELVYSTIVNEVNREMRAEGYSVDKDNPDLLVNVKTMFDVETETVRDPLYGSYAYTYPYTYVDPFYEPYYYTGYTNVPRVVGYDVDQVAYTEGTFVIDLIDAETREVVWRGWVDDRILPSNLKNEIGNYVEEIFEEFPS